MLNWLGDILVIISGLAWTWVYLELIIRGTREKACGMPLFALTLNLAWEWIYGLDGLFGSRSFILAQSLANVVWAICDIFVLITWLRFGRRYLNNDLKRHFVAYTVLALLFGFAMQMAFYLGCPDPETASIYSAFAQNAAMSVLFISQLFSRQDTDGQSMSIAVAKWLGTLAPTLYGQINGNGLARYILITGIVCCVFDLIYIYLLHQKQRPINV